MNEIELQGSTAIQNTQCKTSSQFEEEGKALTVIFFARLKTVYGRKYDTQYKNENEVRLARREWYSEISKLTVNQIETGFAKLKIKIVDGEDDYSWPNIANIIGLCKPSVDDLGLPSLDETIREITERYGRFRHSEFEYSHRVIELISSRVGFHVTQESADKFKQRIRPEYNSFIEQAKIGKLPEKRPALELKIVPTVINTSNATNPFQARIDAMRKKAI